MTRLILTRHGQSIANQEHLFAGHSDFDLSELGYAQAELTSRYILDNYSPDVIYSSDLKRAYNTASPTARALGLEIIRDTRLREIFAGQWESMSTTDIDRVFHEDFQVWKDDYANSRCTGGESVAEAYERAVDAVIDIARNNLGKTVLISTHATMVRAIIANASGIGAEGLGRLYFPHNASVSVFDFENDRIVPVQVNIYEHLGELDSSVPPDFGVQNKQQ